jgi:sulfite reductase (NADPH) hemoprotein beta-component
MYHYNKIDQTVVDERVNEFRNQVERRLSGDLDEADFKALRLMNGLYLQRHAYMLRVAIPYGLLSSKQVRKLAYIGETYDRGFCHVTTRQNVQFNWPKLEEAPDILAHLAEVQMHAIQTSGNCVRNTTADHMSGVAHGEIADPRPYCEILRQWSTVHPEFNYLPRKFKIAFSGCEDDGAAVVTHDIGYYMARDEDGALGYQCVVGGGLGRTPILGKVLKNFVAEKDLLTWTEAVLRVYNLHGNRTNKYKARIKILVRALGVEEMRRRVEEVFSELKDGPSTLTRTEIDRVKAYFAPLPYDRTADSVDAHRKAISEDPAFAAFVKHNVRPHKVPGYNAVVVSLKHPEMPPGDITSAQLRLVADLADEVNFGMVRTTHEQNLMLTDVSNADLYKTWKRLYTAKLAVPNIGTLQDMICCPGLDYCDLANAGSIPIAKAINERFDQLDYLYDLGEIKLKMSGCINACGHHHVGHIGILGINKKGEEWYQIMLGGAAGRQASLGRWIGPAVAQTDVPDTLQKVLEVYVEEREEGERFLDTYRRIGVKPFSKRVYNRAA